MGSLCEVREERCVFGLSVYTLPKRNIAFVEEPVVIDMLYSQASMCLRSRCLEPIAYVHCAHA